MIDFYTWKTPNGRKVAIMLEETKLPHKVHTVDIGNDEQFKKEFLEISPNNKIPAILDHDGPQHIPISVFESGAILIYLAEKTGKFLSPDLHKRMEAIEWLMFQMAGVGPMFGQLNHFMRAAPEKISYAIERYRNEANRIYRVMDKRLSKVEFFAQDYSIADMAIFPWVAIYERQEIDINHYPHVYRWFSQVQERAAVQAGMKIPDVA